MVVYSATFLNGKRYIGITSKALKRRIQQHKCVAKSSNYKLYRAIRKYGFDTVKWEILETINNWETLLLLEQYYIVLFDSFKCGYNMTIGGEGVLGNTFKHSEETKRKISKNWNRYNFKHSEETKKKLGDIQRGKKKNYKVTTETKEKLSKGKLGSKNPMFGKKPHNYKGGLPYCLDCNILLSTYKAVRCTKCNSLTRIKKNYCEICNGHVSNSNNKRCAACKHIRPIGMYDLADNLIKIYNSAGECARINNYQYSNIYKVLTNKRRTHKNHIFRYITGGALSQS